MAQQPHTVIDTPASFNQTAAETVPSIAEIEQHFKVPTLPSDGLFWSSNRTPGDWEYLSNAYAQRPPVMRFTLDLLWKDDWYKLQTDDQTHSADQIREFWNRASQAMASLNFGVVYVLLPQSDDPTGWSDTSTWALVEYPTLTKNGTGVQKICRVNYNYEVNEYAAPFEIWPQVDESQC